MNSAEFIEKRKFIIKIAKMLHKYGTPAYRLEAHLLGVAQFLQIGAAFAITPTVLTFVIWIPGEDTEYTHVARVFPGEMDLGSLSRADEVVDEVLSGQLTVPEASRRLSEIDEMPNPYSRWSTFAAFGAAAGAFAMLMKGSWHDVVCASILSLCVYLFVLWSQKSRRIAHMLESLVAMFAAFAATGLAAMFDSSLNVPLVVLSAIIVFIPGLALTLGLAELAARHLVSGTARIMDAVMLLFMLYFGAFLGMAVGQICFGVTAYQAVPAVPAWTSWLSITILCSSLVIVFRARGKHAFWGLLSGFIAYGASVVGGMYLGLALGAFVGAFAVGIYGNLFTRFMNAPAIIVVLQGMIVLVPGSKTYIGLNAFISGQQLGETAQLGQQTFLIFMSLVAGFIFANVALPPKKSL
ncbi:MAG: threonine/serine exporter family protein [Gammaproteobacteria bacterium]|nr:threonine/serine exporter family protein [Gammaproteobacteria bacterium]MBU2278401.1 threonine/serine exporter family protein [Gammaproteobacteria bacterium]